MSSRDERNEPGFERLRARHAKQPREPDVLVDNAIRSAATQRRTRRRLRAWTVVAALVGCAALAAVLAPALMLESTPSPTTEQEAPADGPDARLTGIRAELAAADAAGWREKILALETGGDDSLASALLADYRERFGRPANFSLDDLAREAANE